MFNISDLTDLKLLIIENSQNAFTLAQTRTLTHLAPPGRLSFIDWLEITAAGATPSYVITSFMVDDVQMITRDSDAIVNSSFMFWQSIRSFVARSLAQIAFPSMMIPFRKKVSITATNSVAAGDLFWRMSAYVHQDRSKEFESTASLQGG